MATKGIQIRIDEKLKKQAEKILDQLGIDMPTAFRMFLKKMVIVNGMPFEVRVEREAGPESGAFPWTQKEIDEAYQESLDPKNLSRQYNLPEEWDQFCKDLRLKS